MINRVAPAFLIPVLLSHLHIFGNSVGKAGSSHMFVLFSLLTCPSVTTLFKGVTALSMKTIKENWSSDYQKTNDAGIPEPDGSAYATELLREEHQTIGLSTVSDACSIGLLIGPAIGSVCMKTIVLLPVLPQGLLQFGSSKTVAEDLEFVTNIKEQFNFIQCVEANPTPLNLGTDSQDWSFSAIALLDG
ncbi:cation-chloride co-transporter [Trifolium repens]|nr:cation-chloride co-transporter [Trifolium repens]